MIDIVLLAAVVIGVTYLIAALAIGSLVIVSTFVEGVRILTSKEGRR